MPSYSAMTSHLTDPLAPESGFSLMEVLITISIIAIALTAVYRLHSQTIAMADATSFHTTAPHLAQGKMVALQLKPAGELADDSGDFGDTHPGYHWKAAISDVESELLSRTKEDLKRIDVTVLSARDQREFSLRRYVFIRE
jgi:prepilin-type N-terminal cleavage/methylation domain-containing protein